MFFYASFFDSFFNEKSFKRKYTCLNLFIFVKYNFYFFIKLIIYFCDSFCNKIKVSILPIRGHINHKKKYKFSIT